MGSRVEGGAGADPDGCPNDIAPTLWFSPHEGVSELMSELLSGPGGIVASAGPLAGAHGSLSLVPLHGILIRGHTAGHGPTPTTSSRSRIPSGTG